MLKMNKKKGASLCFDQIKNKKVASSAFWEIKNKNLPACLICFSKKWPEKHLLIFLALDFQILCIKELLDFSTIYNLPYEIKQTLL